MSELSSTFTEKLFADFQADSKLRAVENAVTHNGLLKSLETRQSEMENDHAFSIDLTKDKVANQKASGRCWMFAALNTFRHKMISDLNLENFELSQAHTFFWDKYEKSNWFLEQVIATADQELGSRKVKFLLDVPQQDGGQWDMVVALFEKYGVVPRAAYPESFSSSNSRELNQYLGSAVFEVLPDIQAQMKGPDVNLKVEIREEAAYLSYENIKGAGGLPVGTAGRGMLMLSGGIDSPVAGYLALKRGVDIEAVHFASPPYTSPGALKKAQDLTRKLTKFGGNIDFIEVPFTEIQEEIKEKAPEAYLMTLTRRFMMRITDLIREERNGLVIINGESLGQVASQTLESMRAINAVTATPIIRPVVTMDKLEIIDIAQKIDTFDISIQPFEDCCTIFAPDRPKTNPKIKNVEQYEKRMDVEGLVERAVAGIKVTTITPQADHDEVDDLIDDLL